VNRRAPLFAAIGMFLLVLIVVFVAIMPKMREVQERRDELEQEQQNEQFLLAELNRLRAARAQLPEVRRRLAKFNQRVPATADLPGLIRLLQNASDASNLEFFSIAPGTPTAVAGGGGAPAPLPTEAPSDTETTPPVVTAPSTSASAIPANITVIGCFFEIDQFLFRIETLPRAAKVTSLTVGRGPDTDLISCQLSVALVVTVYTTDTAAGPGAAPEVTNDGGGTPVVTTPPPTTAAPTTSPTTSPTTTGSPSPTTTGG
jgi:Tfp pilus assembly protein PilO